jgi:hypothetical protein
MKILDQKDLQYDRHASRPSDRDATSPFRSWKDAA